MEEPPGKTEASILFSRMFKLKPEMCSVAVFHYHIRQYSIATNGFKLDRLSYVFAMICFLKGITIHTLVHIVLLKKTPQNCFLGLTTPQNPFDFFYTCRISSSRDFN